MKQQHPLHFKIGQSIEQKIEAIENCVSILDIACGGSHQIPLFIGEQKLRATRTCLVDALILTNKKVKIIIEIEESSFIPTKICGKFLQAAIAHHFIHHSQQNKLRCFAAKTMFLQIIDSSSFSKHTSKKLQAEQISKRISEMLPNMDTKISSYKIIFVSGQDDNASIKSVTDCIEEFLLKNS